MKKLNMKASMREIKMIESFLHRINQMEKRNSVRIGQEIGFLKTPSSKNKENSKE